MREQNFKNHPRIDPPYHYVGSLIVLLTLTGAVIHFVMALINGNQIISAFFLFTGSVGLLLTYVFVRVYALKVQNRVIRAEENFRHYRLTNEMLDSKLTMGQIVSLRFASDQEFPTLCERAVKESMEPIDIKRAIVNWKADHNRI